MLKIPCGQAGHPKGRCAQPSPAGLQALQVSEARLRGTLLGIYPQRKEGEALKASILNFCQILRAVVVLQDLIHQNQYSRVIDTGTRRGVQGPVQLSLLYRAAISMKELPLLHRLAPDKKRAAN